MKKLNVMTVKALRDICHPDTGELLIENNHTYYLDVDSITLNLDGIKADIYATDHQFIKSTFLYRNFITKDENKHEIFITDEQYYRAKSIPTRTINFPVVWKSWGEIQLTVPRSWSNGQILEYFNENIASMPLPREGEYVEESMTSEFTKETVGGTIFREVH